MNDMNDPKNPSELIASIEGHGARLHTTSLDLSFNELLDMYSNKELDISPDYQRLFQWSDGAQSRFIESLLLEMPVPPIYVIEEETGKYSLIDGLQRISSYFHLRGALEASHLDPSIARGDKLELVDCDIVKALNGYTFDALPTALQIRLKRAFVRVEVVRKGSDARFKYHMFKRLNTGGMLLTPQQVRNCTIRLLGPTFNDFIIDLSKTEDFQTCTESLTQEHRLSAFDQELVLRFFAFKNWRDRFVHDVSDFLTEYMEAVSDPEGVAAGFPYEKERSIFTKTFGILAKTLGGSAFCYATKQGNKLTGGFSVYHFESLTLGLQEVIARIDDKDEAGLAKLKDVLMSTKLDGAFRAMTTGGGRNSPGLLKDRIEFVTKAVRPII